MAPTGRCCCPFPQRFFEHCKIVFQGAVLKLSVASRVFLGYVFKKNLLLFLESWSYDLNTRGMLGAMGRQETFSRECWKLSSFLFFPCRKLAQKLPRLSSRTTFGCYWPSVTFSDISWPCVTFAITILFYVSRFFKRKKLWMVLVLNSNFVSETASEMWILDVLGRFEF